MFAPDIKPTAEFLELFRDYLKTQPMIRLVGEGEPGACEPRSLANVECDSVLASFRGTRYPGIGRARGRPLLRHFALDDEGKSVREILLEEMRDLDYCLGVIHDMAKFWKLDLVEVKLPACAQPDPERMAEWVALRVLQDG